MAPSITVIYHNFSNLNNSNFKNIMKLFRYLSLIFVTLLATMPMSANVDFRFKAHSIDNGSIKTTMEKKMSAILSDIDNAGPNQAPTFQGLNVPTSVVNYFNALWNELQTPFQCVSDIYVESCLLDNHGYQVRGLKVEMLPQGSGYTGQKYRNLVVYFDKNGGIRNIRLSPEDLVEVEDIITEGATVEDMAMRYTLLQFVEDFRCYYNEKDTTSLRLIFSDDALIITGKTIEKKVRQNGEMRVEPKVVRTSQTKTEYLNNLKKVFAANKKIDVQFRDIKVMRNSSKQDYYGVVLHQSWKTDNYSDEGWVFLYWDFTNPDEPQIMVRTWQDERSAEELGVYRMQDFNVN